jgi:hypothetical protein
LTYIQQETGGNGYLTLNNCKVFGDSECGGAFELTVIDSYIEQLFVNDLYSYTDVPITIQNSEVTFMFNDHYIYNIINGYTDKKIQIDANSKIKLPSQLETAVINNQLFEIEHGAEIIYY